MPQTRDAKGDYRDIFHPVTKEGREALNGAVLAEFGNALDAMVEQKESTLNRIRESAKAAKGQSAPLAGKETKEKPLKKAAGGPEH
jgi:hypothetical protein